MSIHSVKLYQAEVEKIMHYGVTKKETAIDGVKKHQVFRLSFDARSCVDQKMIEQNLDYIHSNPIKGKWNLAKYFLSYPHSSARFY
jgi:hypothetical protein